MSPRGFLLSGNSASQGCPWYSCRLNGGHRVHDKWID